MKGKLCVETTMTYGGKTWAKKKELKEVVILRAERAMVRNENEMWNEIEGQE